MSVSSYAAQVTHRDTATSNYCPPTPLYLRLLCNIALKMCISRIQFISNATLPHCSISTLLLSLSAEIIAIPSYANLAHLSDHIPHPPKPRCPPLLPHK